MDIKAIGSQISSQSAAAASAATKTQQTAAAPANAADKEKTPKNFKKALPYVAGAVVLAGLGVYLVKGRGSKVVNKNTINEAKQEISELGKKAAEDAKAAVKTAEAETAAAANTAKTEASAAAKAEAQAVKAEVKPAEAPKVEAPAPKAEAKPADAPKAEAKAADAKPAANAADEAKKSVNLNNEEVINKINKNKKDKNDDINRIIGENTKDGHVDLNIMRKVARDFSIDEAGRGADRYHQAADVLEKSYLREFIKTENNVKSGLNNLYENLQADKQLFSIYKKMPLEEAACRLDQLRKNELAECKAAGEMTPDQFFEKAFAKLVEFKD